MSSHHFLLLSVSLIFCLLLGHLSLDLRPPQIQNDLASILTLIASAETPFPSEPHPEFWGGHGFGENDLQPLHPHVRLHSCTHVPRTRPICHPPAPPVCGPQTRPGSPLSHGPRWGLHTPGGRTHTLSPADLGTNQHARWQVDFQGPEGGASFLIYPRCQCGVAGHRSPVHGGGKVWSQAWAWTGPG